MFVCRTESEAKKRVKKLQGLKNLVETIEDKMLIPCSFAGCPAEPPKEPSAQPQLPDIMVCYKTEKVEKKKAGKCPKKGNASPRVRKRAKSRELRAGILYRGCDCEKINGLQDDCRRTGCQGSPECLTKPEPTCPPSEFSNGKHLGKKYNYSTGSNSNDDNVDDEAGGKTTVYYNCYPATIKC